jgi:hypothetical protein
MFSWSSSNPAVASVSASGLVSALSGGTVTITASVDGKSGTGSVTVTGSEASAGPAPQANEPPGMSLVTHNRGTALPEPGWWIWDPSGDLSLVTEASAPVPTSGMIRYRYRQGLGGGEGPGLMGHGSDWQGDPANLKAGGQPVREFYLSFWFRLDPNWQTPGSGQSKLYYVYAMDDRGDRHHIYPVIEGSGTTGPIRIVFHSAVGQTEWRLDPNVSSPNVNRGQWYRLEIHARNASATGVNDGFLRWWIDGALAGDHVNISRPAVAWTELHGSFVWGGGGGTVQREQYIWVNDVYMSGR